MKKQLFLEDKIYIAGSTGMAGSAIIRSLKKSGYGKKENRGEGGGLYKYDKLFGTKGIDYQKKHYYIDFNSKREDKNWAGFCDRAAMLSCLYEYPKRAVKVRVENNEIIFKTRDIEALMIIAADNSTRDGLSVFYGSRNNHKNKSLTGEVSDFYKSKKSEPLPLELLEVLKRFSKENEPLVH